MCGKRSTETLGCYINDLVLVKSWQKLQNIFWNRVEAPRKILPDAPPPLDRGEVMLKLNFADLPVCYVLPVTMMTMLKTCELLPADKFHVGLRNEPQSHAASLEGARCTCRTTR